MAATLRGESVKNYVTCHTSRPPGHDAIDAALGLYSLASSQLSSATLLLATIYHLSRPWQRERISEIFGPKRACLTT
jgi:hypothetical protein